eukprot:8425903-Prorocentrum_lima.AAC.1
MTSSLVGSEMCIRDRSWTNHTAVTVTAFFVSRAATVPSVPFVLCHKIGPVSYTHLTLPTICSV